MKLYIKQKVFSWADHFSVRNEHEEDRYTVEGEVFSLGKKLHVKDMIGNEVAFIKEKVWSWLPRYEVYVRGELVGTIVKEFTFLKQRFHIEGSDWQMEGDFWGHDYKVTQNGRTIISIRKAWFTWGDSYELEIGEGVDELKALAMVLAIDCAAASAAAAAASTSG